MMLPARSKGLRCELGIPGNKYDYHHQPPLASHFTLNHVSYYIEYLIPLLAVISVIKETI